MSLTRPKTTMTRRRRRQQPETSYGRLLAWTTVLALVFSAGLITGQRLLKRQSTPALASVQASGLSKTTPPAGDGAQDQDKEVSFSFYDKLGPNQEGAGLKNDLGQVMRSAMGQPQEGASQDKPADKGQLLPARYSLQVGAHPDMHNAKVQANKLRELGLEPSITTGQNADKGKVYRVRFGQFHSMDEARHFQAELQNKSQIKTFVTPL